ncbi:hypothetical protein BS78_08G091800 [Paspalum vaginatum]|nr:hypothetical protein BS78_08G091800 [Paspalum vaginatum]
MESDGRPHLPNQARPPLPTTPRRRPYPAPNARRTPLSPNALEATPRSDGRRCRPARRTLQQPRRVRADAAAGRTCVLRPIPGLRAERPCLLRGSHAEFLRRCRLPLPPAGNPPASSERRAHAGAPLPTACNPRPRRAPTSCGHRPPSAPPEPIAPCSRPPHCAFVRRRGHCRPTQGWISTSRLAGVRRLPLKCSGNLFECFTKV